MNTFSGCGSGSIRIPSLSVAMSAVIVPSVNGSRDVLLSEGYSSSKSPLNSFQNFASLSAWFRRCFLTSSKSSSNLFSVSPGWSFCFAGMDWSAKANDKILAFPNAVTRQYIVNGASGMNNATEIPGILPNTDHPNAFVFLFKSV